MKKITFQDKAIAYDTVGKGAAVLLIHGFCEDSRMWEDFSQDLVEEKYKVITIDLPGFGQSDVWSDVSIADMAEAVHAVLQVLKQDKVILIGHSMGGGVSTLFAGTWPDDVEKLVLLEGLGPPEEHYVDGPGRVRRWIRELRNSEGRAARSFENLEQVAARLSNCLLYTSPSPRDRTRSRMPSSA